MRRHLLRRPTAAGGGQVAEGLQRLQAKVDAGLCYPFWLPVATFYQGWVHTVSGMQEQGIAELRQGLADIAQRTAWARCHT